MRKLIVMIAIIAGVWYWQKHNSTGAPVLDESGNPAVVVFTVNECAPCQATLDMLTSRGVPFQKKEIDPGNEQDADVRQWRRVGSNMFPLTLSGNSRVKGSSKWELIGLLGDNFGGAYLTLDERAFFKQHFAANGSPSVVLYGTDWCPSCAALRKDFREHGVDFVDIDVEKSSEFDKLTRVMEIAGYPAVWVGYTRVHGTTFDAVKAVMN